MFGWRKVRHADTRTTYEALEIDFLRLRVSIMRLEFRDGIDNLHLEINAICRRWAVASRNHDISGGGAAIVEQVMRAIRTARNGF